jgi:AraC-like DNA-binding protein
LWLNALLYICYMQDWKSYWFLIAGGQGLLLTIGLAARAKRNNSVLIYLAILLGVLSIELLTNFAVTINYPNKPGAFPFWLMGSYLFIPPSLYNLVRYSTGIKLVSPAKSLLLFIPAFIEIIVEAGIFLLRSSGFSTPNLQKNIVWVGFTEIVPVLTTLMVLIWWAIRLKQPSFIKKKPDAGKQVIPSSSIILYVILFYYFALSFLWLAEALLGWRFSDLLAQLLAASMLLLGYLAFLRSGFFDRLSPIPEPVSPLPSSSTEWPYDDELTLKKLQQLMADQKMFEQSRLSVDDLSTALEIPRRYLTHILATHLNTTAISFINHYRVEDVIRKMKENELEHKTILALAMESGFSSKSTFNQVFKVHTGMTPSEYLKNLS